MADIVFFATDFVIVALSGQLYTAPDVPFEDTFAMHLFYTSEAQLRERLSRPESDISDTRPARLVKGLLSHILQPYQHSGVLSERVTHISSPESRQLLKAQTKTGGVEILWARLGSLVSWLNRFSYTLFPTSAINYNNPEYLRLVAKSVIKQQATLTGGAGNIASSAISPAASRCLSLLLILLHGYRYRTVHRTVLAYTISNGACDSRPRVHVMTMKSRHFTTREFKLPNVK
jgi:hypothetical protein